MSVTGTLIVIELYLVFGMFARSIKLIFTPDQCPFPRSCRAMAFQGGTHQKGCWECGKQVKFFKMFQSWRQEHVWYDEDRKAFARLFCCDCELKVRKDEWEDMTEEQRALAGEELHA